MPAWIRRLFVVDLTDPKSLEALAPLLALPQTQAVGTKLLPLGCSSF